MTFDPTWNKENYEATLAILLAAMSFSLFWFISMNSGIKEKYFTNAEGTTAWTNYVVFQKLTGVLFLGVIPAAIVFSTTDYSITDLGLNGNHLSQSILYSAIMCALILLLNYFATNKNDRLKDYPQMRVIKWTPKIILINAFSWAAYLIAYEFLFRGVLLFLCYYSLGFWPAVAINIALYATTHIPKGAGETIGTFPYGLLLCYVTISTGSILVAFTTHFVMALSNDIFSIYHSKEMTFSK